LVAEKDAKKCSDCGLLLIIEGKDYHGNTRPKDLSGRHGITQKKKQPSRFSSVLIGVNLWLIKIPLRGFWPPRGFLYLECISILNPVFR
jgi:hypothetical protein